MSKANKAALDWLPKRKDGRKRYYNCNDGDIRRIYAKGYRKAEKDNELTWEDVREMCTQSVLVEIDLGGLVSDERHYTEVLKRFKSKKHVKQKI